MRLNITWVISPEHHAQTPDAQPTLEDLVKHYQSLPPNLRPQCIEVVTTGLGHYVLDFLNQYNLPTHPHRPA